jgi:hypothetical protein
MATAYEEIEAFLEGTCAGVTHARRMEVAVLFAECMLKELRASVIEWEQTTRALQAAKCRDRQATLG